MGDNAVHDHLSLYSLGWLQGGKARSDALHFPRGATWFISAPDADAGQSLLETVANAALRSPLVCCGMEVLQLEAEKTPEFGPRYIFRANSPILVKGPENEHGHAEHLRFDDSRADAALTQTLRHKLDAAGLGEHSASATMRFVRDYMGAKTRLITIKGIQNRANVCPVIVEGSPEAVQFAWNVGAGNGTGNCFGSLV
jgi:CRISPR-associated endoribonuclease Cas6